MSTHVNKRGQEAADAEQAIERGARIHFLIDLHL